MGLRRKGQQGWMGPPSPSVLDRLPRSPGQRRTCSLLQDLDLDTASPMSPARPATPRAMPPTMAMPTRPSGEGKRETVRGPAPTGTLPTIFSLPDAPQQTCLFPWSWEVRDSKGRLLRD